ncbi:transporter substrate-binding domain-containing protein [Sulfurimonas sediminis]|uniref:histidine kinase n=1 Tax=Sulfurimonas sediminis TaxID=2590020 RepID=A0A7M1B4C4_9BACT|nr:transporter substrate-binding domain-containing protein [Sulfurimonas sediminis]QOP44589.1 transporter substrate-binding domain-containing protein [Sulfurimonas sediminis]
MYKKRYLFFIAFVVFLSFFVLLQLKELSKPQHVTTKNFLTQKEKTWLRTLKKPLSVGITNIPNQVIISPEGKAVGFSLDLFHLLEQELGISFRYISFPSWHTLMDAAKKGKIDIVFAAQKTQERLGYLDFTDVILTQQNKIITQRDNFSVSDIESLQAKSVALVDKSAIYAYIQNKYPSIRIIPYETELKALQAVAAGAAEATISEPVRASYYMSQYNIQNLRVAGDLDYLYQLRIASQGSLPVLNVILSKAVSNLPQQELQALYLKWGYIKDKERYFDKQTLIYLAIAFGIILPFSIYLYFINLSLEREVKRRKDAEDKLRALNQNLQQQVRQEVEKQREQELHMLQQNRLAQMGNMMNMIAHQWKQPLNALSMLMQTVRHKYKQSKLNDDFIEYFDKNAKKQLQEMTKVTNDFMHYFRPKDKLEFSIDEIIGHSINLVKPIFQAKNISITYENKSTKTFTLQNDIIGQVIINILNNAKDALIENNIEDKNIYITLSLLEDKAEITIEDNAGGIPQDIMHKIFDPYFSTKDDTGTGLGLYMSKIIIENYCEGTLCVRNTDKGALFSITVA